MLEDRKLVDPIYSRMLDVLREYVFKVQPGAKITQNDIAKYFATTQNNVSVWKSKGPSLAPLKKLANEFNISLDWLVLGKGSKKIIENNPSKLGYTIKDIGKLFVALSYISDVKISPILSGDPQTEIDWSGVNLSIMPKTCVYFANNNSTCYKKGTHEIFSLNHGQEITVEDSRGRAILNMFHDLLDFSTSCDSKLYTLDTKNNVLSSIIDGMPPVNLSDTFPPTLPIPFSYEDSQIYELVDYKTY